MLHKDPRKIRLLRRHKRNKPATIMLTSMIDIFTVLVFFLIVNSQNQVHLPNNQNMQLPKSNAQDFPKETLTIQITPTDIFVENQHIATVKDVMLDNAGFITALAQELKYRAGKLPPEINAQGVPERSIYILADRHIPYSLLRKIMVTCSLNDFSQISFAVERKHGGSA